MYHHSRDHHTFYAHIYLPTHCLRCNEPTCSGTHEEPPCDWCDDANEFGPPSPWWHRAWCATVVWLFLEKPSKENETKEEEGK